MNCTQGNLLEYYGYSGITQTQKATWFQTYVVGSFVGVFAHAGTPTSGPSSINLGGFLGQLTSLSYNGFVRSSMISNLGFKAWGSDLQFYVVLNDNPGFELHLYNRTNDANQTTWSLNVSCTSSCPSSDLSRSDFDQTNIHTAINIPSEGYALIMILAAADGTSVGSLKTTQS